MPKYTEFVGAIFDVDDTLLNNHPPEFPGGLHEHSRLRAAHEAGKRHANAALQQFTLAQCVEAFKNAQAHTLQAAVWQMLVMAGVVPDGRIDPAQPMLLEIMERKDELHEDLLRTHGREVPGALDFVSALAAQGFTGRLAVASTSSRRDIDLFFSVSRFDKFFPESRIISREQLTHAKPHPQAFDLAFATLGLPEQDRRRVLAFEDYPRGIKAAKAAGLYACAITTCFDREALAGLETPPDLIAGSFAEFAQLLGLPQNG